MHYIENNTMNSLLLAAIIFIGVVLFLLLIKAKKDTREYPYQLSKYLLSRAERSFYGVLVQSIGNTEIVFVKVRLADVIAPKKGLSRLDWQRSFNAIAAKHLDFIVCNANDCAVKLAVELDDASHQASKTQKRDELVNKACQSAGLPLLRIKAARTYAIADLQHQIMAALPPMNDVNLSSFSPWAK